MALLVTSGRARQRTCPKWPNAVCRLLLTRRAPSSPETLRVGRVAGPGWPDPTCPALARPQTGGIRLADALEVLAAVGNDPTCVALELAEYNRYAIWAQAPRTPPSICCAGWWATIAQHGLGSVDNWGMARNHVSETPATQRCSRRTGLPTEHPTNTWSTAVPSTAPRCWVLIRSWWLRPLVMQDQDARRPGADARQPQGFHQEPGSPDWGQIGGALRPEVANRHSGYLVAALHLRHAPQHAGVLRAHHPGPAQNSDQRRATRVPGRYRSAGSCRRCWAQSRYECALAE